MPIQAARTLSDIEAERTQVVLRISGAAAAGGLLALLLSAIGLYAVVAFAVGQRTREIGIRTALGAQRSQIVGMFFTRGVRLSLLGLMIGLPLGLIVLRIMTQMMNLTDQSTAMPATVVALFVLGVASLATWLPARRAAGIDPLITLRSE
jgi:ABC-type antimicrobial peptide transport system permease subunit